MENEELIQRQYRENHPLRLDKFLALELPETTRSTIQKHIEQEKVQVNGKIITEKSYQLQPGDRVNLRLLTVKERKPVPRKVPFEIVYEDEVLLVINKPAGVIVHPAPSSETPSLVEGLLYRSIPLSSEGPQDRPGVIHRLDKETAGILIIAKENSVHRHLVRQMKERKIKRIYRGLVLGNPDPSEGEIRTPFGRHPVHRHKMAVLENSTREAMTFYRVLENYSQFSLVEFELLTGRTHQIRVHMSYSGTPIIGDRMYGASREKKIIIQLGLLSQWNALKEFPAHMLYAARLSFSHPLTSRYLAFHAEPPDFFRIFLENLLQ